VCKEGQRGVACITEKGDTTVGPAKERVPTDKCPLVGRIDVSNDFVNERVPAGKIGRELVSRTGCRPRFENPVVLSQNAAMLRSSPRRTG
jgi:hypothetical protein